MTPFTQGNEDIGSKPLQSQVASFLSPRVTGTLFGILLISLTSCRIGNHVETAPNPDQISGVYETSPTSLAFKVSTPSQDKVMNAPTNQIPGGFDGVLTDPVALVMKNLTTGRAYLVNPINPSAGSLSIYAQSNDSNSGTLSGLGSPSSSTLWDDPNCTLENTFEENGSYKKSGNSMHSFQNYSVIGRISLKIQVTDVIVATTGSSCHDSLQKIYDCYNNANNCIKAGSGETQAQMYGDAHALFDPYIVPGAMTASDILTVTSMIYQIQYE